MYGTFKISGKVVVEYQNRGKSLFQLHFYIQFLSADSLSSALLVGLSKEGGGRRKEGLFSKSLEEMGELKAWGCYSLAIASLLLNRCLAIA